MGWLSELTKCYSRIEGVRRVVDHLNKRTTSGWSDFADGFRTREQRIVSYRANHQLVGN